MADSSITGLSSASTIDGTEVLPVDQSGATKKVTVVNLTPGLSVFVGSAIGSPSSFGSKGLVPAPTDADGSKFLRGDGTWGTPTSSSSAYSTTTVTTTGSAATITFSSISQAFKHARITLSGRDTATGSDDLTTRIKFNSDGTAGNYLASQLLYNNASGSSSATTQAASSAGAASIHIPGSSGLATAVGGGQILIPNYSGTTFHKIFRATSDEYSGNAVTLFDMNLSGGWKSASAITDIVLTAGGTAFVDGTCATMELYG